MALRELKKELNQMDKTEIIKLILEMYKKIPYFFEQNKKLSFKENQCRIDHFFNNSISLNFES